MQASNEVCMVLAEGYMVRQWYTGRQLRPLGSSPHRRKFHNRPVGIAVYNNKIVSAAVFKIVATYWICSEGSKVPSCCILLQSWNHHLHLVCENSITVSDGMRNYGLGINCLIWRFLIIFLKWFLSRLAPCFWWICLNAHLRYRWTPHSPNQAFLMSISYNTLHHYANNACGTYHQYSSVRRKLETDINMLQPLR